jgi:hypothetical protein
MIKYTKIIGSIYCLGIGIGTIYEIRNKNILLDKLIKHGKKVEYEDYIMNSFGGLMVHF